MANFDFILFDADNTLFDFDKAEHEALRAVLETRGYPFAMHVQSWRGRGDMVVPCTMESNVKQLHQYLFGEEDYQPTSTVTEISDAIYDRSGLGEEDALNYGY